MIEDVSIALGVACLAYAGYQVHPAVCWATAGIAFIAVGLGGFKRKARKKEVNDR